METNTTITYYAVCDANGPISVRLDADSLDAARDAFGRLDTRSAIDGASTDAEDDLEIDGADMSEDEFASALRGAGGEMVEDLSVVANAHAGTTAHLAGGWVLWAVESVDRDGTTTTINLTEIEQRAAELGREDYEARAVEVASGREQAEWCWPLRGAIAAWLEAQGTSRACREVGAPADAWEQICDTWLAGFARGYREARDEDREFVVAIGTNGIEPVAIGVGRDEQTAASDVDDEQGEIACYAEIDSATYARIRAGEVACDALGISVRVDRDGQIVAASL